LEGRSRCLIDALSRHLPAATEENHKKHFVRAIGVLIKIRTKHLRNAIPEDYHYDIPLVVTLWKREESGVSAGESTNLQLSSP
jgi:hypothetical protein